jgi:hypothetical protein
METSSLCTWCWRVAATRMPVCSGQHVSQMQPRREAHSHIQRPRRLGSTKVIGSQIGEGADQCAAKRGPSPEATAQPMGLSSARTTRSSASCVRQTPPQKSRSAAPIRPCDKNRPTPVGACIAMPRGRIAKRANAARRLRWPWEGRACVSPGGRMRRVTTHGCAAETESSSTRSSEIGPLRASEIRSCVCTNRKAPQALRRARAVRALSRSASPLQLGWAGWRAEEGY